MLRATRERVGSGASKQLFEWLPKQLSFFNDLYRAVEKFEANHFCCCPPGEDDSSVVFATFGFPDEIVADKLSRHSTCWLFDRRELCSTSDLFCLYRIFGVLRASFVEGFSNSRELITMADTVNPYMVLAR